MNYLIEPQTNPAGMLGKCTCNCTINFGVVKGSGCGAKCASLVVCVAPSGAKVSPTNS